MINDIARTKLSGLKRSQVLPFSTLRLIKCPVCQISVPRSRYRKRCPRSNCRGLMPPKPPLLCRLCNNELPGRRTSWCSDECSNAYYMATSSSHLRYIINQRDKGICAKCGLDCEALERRINAMPKEAVKEVRRVLVENGFNWSHWNYNCASLWDADHIEPIDEGGSSWEMENIQTLCHPCHKEKTAEQAARGAKQRKLIGRKAIDTNKRLKILETISATKQTK